jgi:hypothetical protein
MRFIAFILALMSCFASPARAIIGAQGSSASFTPHLLMVLREGGAVCSGVVITSRVILTAAHCVGSSTQSVRIHFRKEDGTPELLIPERLIKHPAFKSDAIKTRSRSVDLALIQLSHPLPTPFTPASLSADIPSAGSMLTVAGFGASQGKSQEKHMNSIGQLRSTGLTTIMPYGASSLLIWAKSADNTPRGACQGDSGGAIFFGHLLVAITSWSTGHGATTCGNLTQGILLTDQQTWIDTTLSQWGEHAAWNSRSGSR